WSLLAYLFHRLVRRLDDDRLDILSERDGPGAAVKGVDGFVATLPQDTYGGNITDHVVGISRHPEGFPLAAELFLEADGVVDDHFAGERQHCQLVAHGHGLHGIIWVFREDRLAPVNGLDHAPGVIFPAGAGFFHTRLVRVPVGWAAEADG